MYSWKQKQTLLLPTAFKRLWYGAVTALLVLLSLPAIALAAQSNSSNYQVNEVFFGSGGELNACSTSFCTKQSAGELAAGTTSSSNFQAHAGFNTDREPYIQVSVSNTNVDLGTLTPTTTKTTNASFSVKAYLAHGYSVVNASDPPKNNNYTMQPMAIPAPSAVGTEQFGINLVANTNPVTFGANPTHDPDASFSFGQVSTDYNAADYYKYAKGDVIAFSTSSTSATNYTISYLFNISNVTPGGHYEMHHVLVATGTY